MTTKTKHLKSAIAVVMQVKMPVLLWGAPGGGKTSTISSIAKRLGYETLALITSLMEPGDLLGLPIVTETELPADIGADGDDGFVTFSPSLDGKKVKTTVHAVPHWAIWACTKRRVVVFFDEIDKTPPTVANTLLSTIYGRRLHLLRFPNEVIFVAAANPVGEGGDWELSLPMANRFCHIPFDVDVDTLVAGFTTGNWDDEIPIVNIDKYQALVPKWLSLVAAFLRRQPNLKRHLPKDVSQQSRAWASPRTWEMAAKLMAASEAAGVDDEVRGILLSGCVGSDAAIPFVQFVNTLDLPHPQVILETFKLPKNQDALVAVLVSIPPYIVSAPDKEWAWKRAWELVLHVEKTVGADFALILMKGLKGVGDQFDTEVALEAIRKSKMLDVFYATQ